MGREEFVICIPDISLLEAEEMADIIRMNISQTIIPYMDIEISVTSSFGISSA